MGGTIAVTSVAGKGSTFVLRLRLPVDVRVGETKPPRADNVIYLDAVQMPQGIPTPQLQ